MILAYRALARHMFLSPDVPGAGGGNGNPPANPPADPPATPPPGEGDDDDDGEEGEEGEANETDVTKLKEALRKQRIEARKARKEARDAARERDTLTAQQQEEQRKKDEAAGNWEKVAGDLRTENSTLKTQLADERDARKLDRVMAAVQVAASGMRFHNPMDVTKFLDLKTIKVNETTGEPIKGSVEKALTDLAEERKYLVNSGNGIVPLPPHREGDGSGNGGQPSLAQGFLNSRYVPRK